MKIEVGENKYILDVCCGGRMFWFDKKQENTIYMDIRELEKGSISQQPNFEVKPDIIASWENIPFNDNTFNLVVWDIPHAFLKNYNSIIAKKYGYLDENYKKSLTKGFREIMRVLKPCGVLTLKYADISIAVRDLLDLFDNKPLYGTKTKKGVNNTYWFTFIKERKQIESGQISLF